MATSDLNGRPGGGTGAASGPARRFDRAAAAWVFLLAIASAVCIARAETDGLCARCAKWVKLSDEGTGLDRGWQGLCGACQDPTRRCDEVLKYLEKSVEYWRDELGYYRRELNRALHHKKTSGGDANMPGEQSYPIDEFIADMQCGVEASEKALADYERRLAAARAECGVAGGGEATGGSGGGAGSGSAADAVRDLQQQVDRLNRLSGQLADQLKTLEAQIGTSDAEQVAGAPIEASEIDAAERYMKPLAEATQAPAPAASTGSEATAAGTEVASQDEAIRPILLDLRTDLPKAPVARSLALSGRHAANAAACADALRRTLQQIDAAKAAGNAERARKHLDRALYLAAAGQKAHRQASAERTGSIQKLCNQSKSLEREAQKRGTTIEGMLAAWQADVRANGLPAAYVESLKKAGIPEDQIAKRREWLQGVDPKATAEAQARFLRFVAPFYLPAARGKANAPALSEADDLWEMATILLLHSERPAPEVTTK